jgi:hypothetical protein
VRGERPFPGVRARDAAIRGQRRVPAVGCPQLQFVAWLRSLDSVICSLSAAANLPSWFASAHASPLAPAIGEAVF